ncbi:substrate-binding domain-containing protein [Streptomyces sp. NPDC002896]|uniref:substrate-binding domain-containing protein n=1 Tax=Streptomyces sp. NPDC002896 TaxID=3154438 RepID=UPI003320E8B5
MVAGRSHSLAGSARLHGYRAALEEAGIACDPDLVRSTDFDFDEALVAGLRILRSDHPPTAVFAASDAQALGVLEAARQQGLSVPDDLAVMSFDDTRAAAMSCPPLSAVRQPFGELGHEATRVLMQLAEGRPPASSRIELATQLADVDVRSPQGLLMPRQLSGSRGTEQGARAARADHMDDLPLFY